jgi:hypothetical protein
MINQEWKIKARGHVCSVTGRAFADDEPFHTAIFEDASADGFVRRDFSVEAWDAERQNLTPFSHWRSVYEAPKEDPRKAVVEKETAESLLRRLIDTDEPSTENARFVLAVMLERKRTLRETDSRRLGDAMLRIYEHKRTGEAFIIRDPMLRLDQIDSIQAEFAALLRQSEGAPAAAPAHADEPARGGRSHTDPAGGGQTAMPQ